jgi:hypothetical protein
MGNLDVKVNEVDPRDGLRCIPQVLSTGVKRAWILAEALTGVREIEAGSLVPLKFLPVVAVISGLGVHRRAIADTDAACKRAGWRHERLTMGEPAGSGWATQGGPAVSPPALQYGATAATRGKVERSALNPWAGGPRAVPWAAVPLPSG